MAEYKPVSGADMFNALRDRGCIIMAANLRITKGTGRGIFRAAKDTDSALIVELARSECNLEGGYTGHTPATYSKACHEIAQEVGFDIWALHADHIQIRKGTSEEIEEVKKLISAQIEAGYTSFAIDASYLFNFDGKTPEEELARNIEVTTEVAKFIEEKFGHKDFGLEVEVGEIGKKDAGGMVLTTPEEATAYIKSLKNNGIEPDVIAIANGSTHGNIFDEHGRLVEQVSIDIELTKRVAAALREQGAGVQVPATAPAEGLATEAERTTTGPAEPTTQPAEQAGGAEEVSPLPSHQYAGRQVRQPRVHVVQPHETLYSIARKYYKAVSYTHLTLPTN